MIRHWNSVPRCSEVEPTHSSIVFNETLAQTYLYFTIVGLYDMIINKGKARHRRYLPSAVEGVVQTVV